MRRAAFSTDALPEDRRLATWLDRGWPSVAALFDVQVQGPFATTAEAFMLDDLIVQFAEGSARRYDRSRERLRDDRIDILGVNITMVDGMTVTVRGETMAVPARAVLLIDAAQPVKLKMPAGESIQIVLPRGIAEAQFGSVANIHGTIIPPDAAAILVSHLLRLPDIIADFSPEQGRRLERTIIDLLALVLDSKNDAPRATTGQEPMLAMARREIEERLGLSSLTVASLCRQLRVSRSTLYRLFDKDGGIETYIRHRRLERVRQALRDPASTERIVDLAFRWGFSDASHLSRQFRETYGMTPTAYRLDGR